MKRILLSLASLLAVTTAMSQTYPDPVSLPYLQTFGGDIEFWVDGDLDDASHELLGFGMAALRTSGRTGTRAEAEAKVLDQNDFINPGITEMPSGARFQPYQSESGDIKMLMGAGSRTTALLLSVSTVEASDLYLSYELTFTEEAGSDVAGNILRVRVGDTGPFLFGR
ncbi:MAG: hypothetical protein HC842_03645 [Cytophagales bacterium]|nr:hypothetical protein [Cytophagales bacterium]